MHSRVPQIPLINTKEPYLKIPNPKQTVRIFGQMEIPICLRSDRSSTILLFYIVAD